MVKRVKPVPPEMKKMPSAPSVEPTLDGHYELNPLMTRMLHNELQNVMIKVWHVLPDNPPTEEERLVVEKFRTRAGDDIGNALGLNVTKRLLNIHNPLFIKVRFSTKPEIIDLKRFLKKFGVIAFKRLPKVLNTFIAQMSNISDFDRLCQLHDLFCGDAKVMVTPCYKFTHCPARLKTPFSDTQYAKKDTKEFELTQTPNTINANKELQLKNDTDVNAKTKDLSIPTTKEVPKQATKPVVTKNDEEINKPKNNIQVNPKAKNNGPKEVPKQAAKPAESKHSEALIEPKNNLQTNSKTKKIEPKEEPNQATKTVDNKKNEALNKPKNKMVANKVESKESIKMVAAKKGSANNLQVKNTPVKKMNVKPNTDRVNNKPDDFEEMNDQDILALISEGIVLDECSGSDEDQ